MDNQLSELSLVDLLHAHSDIDTKSLCSLACVSTGFKTAVDSIWAARSVDYRRRVLARPRPPPHVPVWTGKYLWESDYHVEKDASGKASLRFIFSGVWGGSKHAWLSSVQARRDFLLDTGDP